MAISGIGINSADVNVKEKEEEIESILAAINAQNKGLIEEEERKRKEQEEEEENKRRQEEEEKIAQANKERFEREQEDKKRRRAAERQKKEEEEKVRERNPFYSTIKKIKKKPGSEATDDFDENEEEEEEEEESETYGAFIARNALEKGGDIIRGARENFGKKKHDFVQSVTERLSKIGGFEAPEFTEYNPSEEFAKRQEKKQIKKEEKEAKRKEMEEKKRLQKEEQARIAQEKKEAAEKKREETRLEKEAKAEQKRREAEAIAAAEEKKKEDARLAAERAAREKAEAEKAKKPAAPSVQAPAPEPMTPEEYDKHLSAEARDLKMLIQKEHTQPDFSVTEHAVNEIQKMKDVVAVIIASSDMNHLFIFHEPATFIGLAEQLNKTMNYSYIYVVTTTAPVYFGADRCYHGLTDLFNQIREIILRYGHVNRNVLLKINGINMFKNIHLDA